MQNDREEGDDTEKTRCFDVEEDWQWRGWPSVGGVLTWEWGPARFNSSAKKKGTYPVWDAFLSAPTTGSAGRCYVRNALSHPMTIVDWTAAFLPQGPAN